MSLFVTGNGGIDKHFYTRVLNAWKHLNTITKLGIAAGVIALVVWGAKAAQKTLSAFQFDIVGYGKPSLLGTMLTVPFQIRYKNPTPLPISVDQLTADIYLNKNGTFVQAARVNQPVTLQPGESTQWLSPTLNLENVFGGNFLNTLAAIQHVLLSKKLTIRTDAIAVFKGVALPSQSFTNTIDL
ncbi:MAG: hypothetical protein ACRC1W_01320 [Shewanella sp.]